VNNEKKEKIEKLTKEIIEENKDLIEAFEIYDKTGKITEGLKIIKVKGKC